MRMFSQGLSSNFKSSRLFAMAAVVVLGSACLGSPSPAHAQEAGQIKIERPGDKEFVRDLAGILREEDKKKIQEIGLKLLKEKATPIIVVTIERMADYGGAGMRIETFATLLFNQWGIGHEKLNGQDWNTGILVLVSQYDRKARIELGAYWKRDKDALAQQIMNDLMVPQFKSGDYSTGIVAGVEALDNMARGLQIPTKPTPWWHYALLLGFVGVVIFTVVSLIRRGASGWAWLMWAAIFGLVGYLLYSMMQNSRNNSGGFGGGSFGGGFSGGGGATGSW